MGKQLKLGYTHKPRNWYQELNPEQTELQPQNPDEEALKELMPTGERNIFKSHLERGGETQRPHEIITQKIEEDSYHRIVYTRQINDLNTADPSLQELRNAEYTVEIMQGNSSAGAHRQDTTTFEQLPGEIQQIFKTHDEKQWYRQ